MASGFSMIETVISLALSLVVSSTALSLVRPFGLAARTVPEAADVQQRARVAADRRQSPMHFPPAAQLPDGVSSQFLATSTFPLHGGMDPLPAPRIQGSNRKRYAMQGNVPTRARRRDAFAAGRVHGFCARL